MPQPSRVYRGGSHAHEANHISFSTLPYESGISIRSGGAGADFRSLLRRDELYIPAARLTA